MDGRVAGEKRINQYLRAASDSAVFLSQLGRTTRATRWTGERLFVYCVAAIHCMGELLMRNVTALASAFALIAAPTVAAPAFAAPAANKASSLSVARASTPTAKKSNLAGAGLAAAVLAAGIAAIGVIAIVNDNDDSDSN
jgi:hypothetical protein